MVDFFPTEVPLPFQSTRDLATEAAKQLTYAPVNPQPAEPFTQVGNDQLIALKRLAAIFEGTLPKHRKRMTTPFSITTVSHIRGMTSLSRLTRKNCPYQLSAPRVVVPTASNQITPNSHRRLETTPCRFFTPITPHQMTRRSAEPLNLSQYMLDETVKQADHIFFPTNTKEHTRYFATNKK
jgi:hypothetical protein